MKIEKIYIYPVKSLGTISLSTTEVLGTGFKYDRNWLLLSEQGEVLTQRAFPILSKFTCELMADHLKVNFEEAENSIQIPFDFHGDRRFDFKLWDDQVTGFEVNEVISDWFSDNLGVKVHLLYQSQTHPRPVDHRYAKDGTETVSFADGYPILLISEESLSLLNSKLTKPVDMLRFRPNLVISGLKPHQEDELRLFKIGDVELIGVKKCARCIMINLNTEHQIFEKEPLQVLASYRREGHKVHFGQNLLVHQTGMIKVGQMLEEC